MYSKLVEMSGEECYTLSHNSPATMYADAEGVTIEYETGNTLFISRDMVERAINALMTKRQLSVEDVLEITYRDGARTDRLMAVLRKLPGVTFEKRPRALYYELNSREKETIESRHRAKDANYYRLILGKRHIHAEECIDGNFVGIGVGPEGDLTGKLPDDLRTFNHAYIPLFLAKHPEKSKVEAGSSGSIAWTVCKGIEDGDIILSPDGTGQYFVGEVSGEYWYEPEDILPHRRTVFWSDQTIDRSEMSDALQGSTGAIRTVVNLNRYEDEIESLLEGVTLTTIITTDETIQDPVAFAMEKHLEDFLVRNWAQTELGRDYDIFADEEGDIVGQQYLTDTGPMDILAISKDGKTLLVVELKKGRASDVVVGQIMRYMGYVHDELLEANQKVRGVIIAQEDDHRLRRALAMAPDVDFYRYEIAFRLVKG